MHVYFWLWLKLNVMMTAFLYSRMLFPLVLWWLGDRRGTCRKTYFKYLQSFFSRKIEGRKWRCSHLTQVLCVCLTGADHSQVYFPVQFLSLEPAWQWTGKAVFSRHTQPSLHIWHREDKLLCSIWPLSAVLLVHSSFYFESMQVLFFAFVWSYDLMMEYKSMFY